MTGTSHRQADGVRILHIAQSTAGGIASYFEEIADYQTAAYGRDNVAWVVPKGAAHLPRVDPGQLITFDSAARSPAALLDFTRTVMNAIDERDPHLVHLHSTYAGALIRARLALRNKRPRIIYCPHGWSFAMEVSKAKRLGYAAVERALARMTDLLHVNSRTEFDLAVEYGISADRMKVLANGISWTPQSVDEVKDGPLRIGFFGRHDRQKGIDILLEAIQRIQRDDIIFEIVGDGILSSGARPRKSLPNVNFHGWLERDATLNLMERMDAVIMPSRWDAAPIVAIEALRAGVPVIGSNRGAIPEIVGDGIGGRIFDLDNPGSLDEIFRSLDRQTLAPLGRSGRTRWEERYRSDKMNELTCSAYADVLSSAHYPSMTLSKTNGTSHLKAGNPVSCNAKP